MTLHHLIFLALAVSGVLLSNRKRRSCYLCWIASNSAWAVINWYHGLHIEALQNAIFLYLAVEGIVKWRGERW
ncbi:MAG: Nicotinamide mononucleotide transporter [Syntrophorhabdus sp. PtaU1.Bin050]|nr:MAG: Nicotinamide mononucleotide transporter [Syntrophorhabdus sp. PtaU1.Bin050]